MFTLLPAGGAFVSTFPCGEACFGASVGGRVDIALPAGSVEASECVTMTPETDGGVVFVTVVVPTELAFAQGATLQFSTVVTTTAAAETVAGHRAIFEVGWQA